MVLVAVSILDRAQGPQQKDQLMSLPWTPALPGTEPPSVSTRIDCYSNLDATAPRWDASHAPPSRWVTTDRRESREAA